MPDIHIFGYPSPDLRIKEEEDINRNGSSLDVASVAADVNPPPTTVDLPPCQVFCWSCYKVFNKGRLAVLFCGHIVCWDCVLVLGLVFYKHPAFDSNQHCPACGEGMIFG